MDGLSNKIKDIKDHEPIDLQEHYNLNQHRLSCSSGGSESESGS
jgi:hypothetical protein